MKKSTFRVKLMEGSTSLCDTLVVLAAKSNGGEKKLSLEQLKTVADAEVIKYPHPNIDTQVELIGENLLHIDRKIGDDFVTVAIIEQIEVFEVSTPEFENTHYLAD